MLSQSMVGVKRTRENKESYMGSSRLQPMQLQKNNHCMCPAHDNYEITNICTMDSCLEPLCPECITIHLKIHE